MKYLNRDMNLEEYFYTCMGESGFTDDSVEISNGLYRDEAEFYIIADYLGSMGEFSVEDVKFLHKLGYVPEDFYEEEWY